MISKSFFICCSIVLNGCTIDSNGHPKIACGEKPLLSVWSSNGLDLDLTGSMPKRTGFQFSDGRSCTFTIKLSGGTCSGTVSVTDADPLCAQMSGEGIYTKDVSGLGICFNSGCEAYK